MRGLALEELITILQEQVLVGDSLELFASQWHHIIVSRDRAGYLRVASL